jgi:transposase-like protein
VQRFTPLLVDAAGPCRHAVGGRWYVDETYVKVAGRWRYVYRAIDQSGQIIDLSVSPRRDIQAARRFFAAALGSHGEPAEVVTDRAWTLLAVVDELMPGAFHNTEQYANNRIESDHGRLKSRSVRCAASHSTTPHACSCAATLSCRTCGEATTNSGSKPTHAVASRPRSPNSPESSNGKRTAARSHPTRTNEPSRV